MIKKVTVINNSDESIELELASPEKSGLAIKSITGLGPVKANVNINEIVTSDIGTFNSARLTKRNILLSIIYFPRDVEDTAENVRLLSYKYFPIKKKVKLVIETDIRKAYVYGYVESNEVDIFNKQSGAQISLLCADPHFYDVYSEDETKTYYGIQNVFEFPFENDSLEQPMIEMGKLASTMESTNILTNLGDTEVGFKYSILFKGSVINPRLINVGNLDFMCFDSEKVAQITGTGFGNGDVIEVNTIQGQKSITLIRGLEKTNILSALTKDSSWLTLPKGKNTFYLDAVKNRIMMDITYTYTITYEGL